MTGKASFSSAAYYSFIQRYLAFGCSKRKKRRDELSDDRKKVKLNMSDLDKQSKQEETMSWGGYAFADSCVTY